MLIEARPDWAKLEALYAPSSAQDFKDFGELGRRRALKNHFHEYAPRNLKIRDKDGDLVPFKMNRSSQDDSS